MSVLADVDMSGLDGLTLFESDLLPPLLSAPLAEQVGAGKTGSTLDVSGSGDPGRVVGRECDGEGDPPLEVDAARDVAGEDDPRHGSVQGERRSSLFERTVVAILEVVASSARDVSASLRSDWRKLGPPARALSEAS